MDDFKRSNIKFTTGWDLIGCPVYYRPSERRKLLKMARRQARRKLRAELSDYNLRYYGK